MRTTVGQLLVNEALPEELRDYNRVIDKGALKDLLTTVARDYPDRYRQVSHELNQVGRRIVRETGGYGFTLDHLRTAKAAQATREKIRTGMKSIFRSGLQGEAKRKAIIDLVSAEVGPQQAAIFKELKEAENPLAYQVMSGARGNASNLAGLVGSDLLYTDPDNEVIPVPILNSYSEGLSEEEYFAAAYGVRQGVLATKGATADSGFVAKQLGQLAHRLVVTADDDDAEPLRARGLPVDTDDMDSEGALLASPVGGYERNTVLTPKILQQLNRGGHKKILVRSPVASDNRAGGVYAKDVGIRETGHLPTQGTFVGPAAAQAISEPLSQSTLSAKHSGGVAGETKSLSGFAYINQMLQVPKVFQGGATHAQLDGLVSSVRESPAGGYNVKVGNELHYIPAGVPLKVKVGDDVEAGDVLSGGTPNPREIVKHKGIGEGRRYFVKSFRQGLNDSGLPSNRRNVELIARGLIDHVKMNAEYGDHVPDDVVPYSVVSKDYTPREGFKTLNPKKAVGKYLESPVLHHTIGTRITPSVAKELEEFSVADIDVHDDEPIFRPHMVRAMGLLQHDQDWMTQQYGSNLKKSITSSVHRGSVSDEGGTSFVPSLARSVDFGKQGPLTTAPKANAPTRPVNLPTNLFDLNEPNEKIGLFETGTVPGSKKFELPKPRAAKPAATASTPSLPDLAPPANTASTPPQNPVNPKINPPPSTPVVPQMPPPALSPAPATAIAPNKQYEAYWNYPKPSPSLAHQLDRNGNDLALNVHTGYAPQLVSSADDSARQEYESYRKQWDDWRSQQQAMEQRWANSPGEQQNYFEAWDASPFARKAEPTEDRLKPYFESLGDSRDAGEAEWRKLRDLKAKQYGKNNSRYQPSFAQAFGDVDRDLATQAVGGGLDFAGLDSLTQQDPRFNQYVASKLQPLGQLPENELTAVANEAAKEFYGPRLAAFNRLETTFNQFGDELYSRGATEWANSIPGLQDYADANNTGLRLDDPNVLGRWSASGQLSGESDPFLRLKELASSQQIGVNRAAHQQAIAEDGRLRHAIGGNSYQQDPEFMRKHYESVGYTPEQAAVLAAKDKQNLKMDKDPTVLKALGNLGMTAMVDIPSTVTNAVLSPASLTTGEADKAVRGVTDMLRNPLGRALGYEVDPFKETYTDSMYRRMGDEQRINENPEKVLEEVSQSRAAASLRKLNPQAYQRIVDQASAGDRDSMRDLQQIESASRADNNGYLDKLEQRASEVLGAGTLQRTFNARGSQLMSSVPMLVGGQGMAKSLDTASKPFRLANAVNKLPNANPGFLTSALTGVELSPSSAALLAAGSVGLGEYGRLGEEGRYSQPQSQPQSAVLASKLPAVASQPAADQLPPTPRTVESEPTAVAPTAATDNEKAPTTNASSSPNLAVLLPLLLPLLMKNNGGGQSGGQGGGQSGSGGGFNLQTLLALIPLLSKLNVKDFKTLTQGKGK